LEREEALHYAGVRSGGGNHITSHGAAALTSDYRPLEWQWMSVYVDREPRAEAQRVTRIIEAEARAAEARAATANQSRKLRS
jgi:hypothetical protein